MQPNAQALDSCKSYCSSDLLASHAFCRVIGCFRLSLIQPSREAVGGATAAPPPPRPERERDGLRRIGVKLRRTLGAQDEPSFALSC